MAADFRYPHGQKGWIPATKPAPTAPPPPPIPPPLAATPAPLIICRSCGERLDGDGTCGACSRNRKRRLEVLKWMGELRRSIPAGVGTWKVRERVILHTDPLAPDDEPTPALAWIGVQHAVLSASLAATVAAAAVGSRLRRVLHGIAERVADGLEWVAWKLGVYRS